MGAAAGACARVFTTPISNVVTRKQTASLITSDGSSDRSQSPTDLSFAEVLHVIRAEKGLRGLWAGYGATLVLTLNPSITFYLQHALKKALVDRGREGESGGMVFLVAALSKVVATAVTYPFNIAKARVQVSAPESPKLEPEDKSVAAEAKDAVLAVEQNVDESTRAESPAKAIIQRLRHLAGETIFATVMRIGKTEGISSLYDGISGELLKAFFNHGTTMLSKDIAHGLIVRLYFFILAFIRRSPAAQALLSRGVGERLTGQVGDQIYGKYGEVKDGFMRGALVVTILEWTQKGMVVPK